MNLKRWGGQWKLELRDKNSQCKLKLTDFMNFKSEGGSRKGRPVKISMNCLYVFKKQGWIWRGGEASENKN